MEVLAQSRSDMVNGHILALPFSDRYTGECTCTVACSHSWRLADPHMHMGWFKPRNMDSFRILTGIGQAYTY